MHSTELPGRSVRPLACLLMLFALQASWGVSAHAQCSAPSFRSAPNFVSGNSPYAAAAGDFNGDGRADLVVLNTGSDETVSEFLSAAGGDFEAAKTFKVGNAPRGLAVADVNGDSKLDIVTASFDSGAVVALGDGAGSFGTPAVFPAGVNPVHVAVGDFNGDGKADLVVANASSGNVSILLGNGSGAFGAPTNFAVGANTRYVLVADFNNDGKADFAAVNTNTANVSVRLGDGAGGFGALTNYSVGASPEGAAAADFNGDGRLDLGVANMTGSGISVLLGNGDGSFAPAPVAEVPTGSSPSSVVARDFDGDGRVDLAAAANNLNSVALLKGDGTGRFASPTYYGVGGTPRSIVSADFNGDGTADLATANFGTTLVTLLAGTGGGNFAAALNLTSNDFPYGVAVADFNNDGRPDVANADINQSDIAVYLANASGGFGRATRFQAMHDAYNVLAADFNNDGNVDLAATGHTFGLIVLIGNGQGGFGVPTSYPTGSFSTEAIAGDFNHDGKVDVAVSDNSAGAAFVLLGDGAGGFAPATAFGTAPGVSALASGDFNEDGNTDLAVTNTGTTVSILLGNGMGGHSAPKHFPAGTRPFSVAVADFDGDTHADLVIANQTSNDISILKGDGAGNFSAPTNYPAGVLTNSVVVADFNADAKPDVATVNIEGNVSTVSVFLGDGAGGVSPATNFNVGRGSSYLKAADMNGDGRPDIVVTNRSSRTISILYNTCAGSPQPARELTIEGVSVAESDSGTTQATLNVRLSAASERPVAVGFYTFDGTATLGSDYQKVSGRIVFQPGVTSQTVSVPVSGDAATEFDESFGVGLSDALGAVIKGGRAQVFILNDDPTQMAFSAAGYTIGEKGGSALVTVTRTGTLTSTAMVAFATANGTASDRSDYTAAFETLTFGPGESAKTLKVFITDDAFVEGDETVTLTLSDPAGAVLADPSTATLTIKSDDVTPPTSGTNPINGSSFFVRQHYTDFLNREPDAPGLAFWTQEIEQCGSDAQCREVKRINVSAAFFLSIEFQETSYLVYRSYKAAYGDATSPNVEGTVPVVRLSELLGDGHRIGQGVIVGLGDWQAQLEANKQAYELEFVQRPRFTAAFPVSMSADAFVAKLDQNAGGVLTAAERTSLVNILAPAPSDAQRRAQVVRQVAENATLRQREFNRAFVLTQYFGYLRRDPDAAPDGDFRGWKFWLDKLNEFNGNYIEAEMVKAFISSDEYRNRFGQP